MLTIIVILTGKYICSVSSTCDKMERSICSVCSYCDNNDNDGEVYMQFS